MLLGKASRSAIKKQNNNKGVFTIIASIIHSDRLHSVSHKFARLIGGGLLCLCVWYLAQITWLVFAAKPAQPITKIQALAQSNAASTQVSVRTLQALNLFGKPGQTAQETQQETVPVTRLNIRLVGVTASTNPNRSAAIIQQGSEQNTYIPGDTISQSTAVVERILPDRILLKNAQQLETLWLEGRDGSEVSLDIEKKEQTAPSEAKSLLEESPLLAGPQQAWLDNITFQPARLENKALGLKVIKIEDAKLAQGLQEQDILVAVNGYELTEPSQAQAFLQQIKATAEFELRIYRNGDYIEMKLKF